MNKIPYLYLFVTGVALGVIATLMHHIPDDVFLIAARELAASVRDEDLEVGSLYPPLDAIREVSLKIAIGITKYAYCKGMSYFFFLTVFLLKNCTAHKKLRNVRNSTHLQTIKNAKCTKKKNHENFDMRRMSRKFSFSPNVSLFRTKTKSGKFF